MHKSSHWTAQPHPWNWVTRQEAMARIHTSSAGTNRAYCVQWSKISKFVEGLSGTCTLVFHMQSSLVCSWILHTCQVAESVLVCAINHCQNPSVSNPDMEKQLNHDHARLYHTTFLLLNTVSANRRSQTTFNYVVCNHVHKSHVCMHFYRYSY